MATKETSGDSSPTAATVTAVTIESNQNETAKLQAMVTPEQVLSASVARKRRNVTKKRSQSGGGRPRDPTPVRDLLIQTDEKDVEDETPSTPSTPSPQTQQPPQIETTKDPTPPITPTRRSREQTKPPILRKKSDPPSEEILSLLNTAKRSVSSHGERSRKPLAEKKAIIKRSQSTPRQLTLEDTDLIESFKKAQRLSAEVGTSQVPPEYSSSESIPSSTEDEQLQFDIDQDELKKKLVKEQKKLEIERLDLKEKQEEQEKLEKERQDLKEKLLLIKKEKREKQTPQKETAPSFPIAPIEKPRESKIFRNFLKEAWRTWKVFLVENDTDYQIINSLRNRCLSHIFVMLIFCGLGGCIFRFTEGAFESFYKCGVKRVKRDFIDSLWLSSHNLREDDWKSLARRKLWDFEEQLHTAHEAGIHSYSGQRSWSFLNAVVYCITVITTIGYGHITPSTTTGRAITIIYAIFGIPMFLILLADFGKLFTRCIKFVWAFVRRLYYTGSCRKVRKTETVQDVMKGVQMVYEIATFRRPSQIDVSDVEVQQQPAPSLGGSPANVGSDTSIHSHGTHLNVERPEIGVETPNTPAPSNFAVDDEFNLPVTVAILILVLYLLGGATIYWAWEPWSFFESFYFVFISMSTIGFGDFVPQHPMYMMASIMYLVFGLALTSMCINVVQVKLSDTFRQASAKIGATIGLRMADDEGSLAQAPTIEIAEVHSTKKKDKAKNKEKDVDVDIEKNK